jgi:hypothetical protein
MWLAATEPAGEAAIDALQMHKRMWMPSKGLGVGHFNPVGFSQPSAAVPAAVL